MALRAGYYGIKRVLRDKLNNIIPIDASDTNKLATENEISDLFRVNSLYGVKNLLVNNATNSSTNNLSFVKNSDNTITITPGSASGATSKTFKSLGKTVLPNGKYKVKGGVSSKCVLQINNYADNASIARSIDNTDFVEFDVTDSGITVYIVVEAGEPSEAVTIYPMVQIMSDNTVGYRENALSNIDLTKSAADQKTAINAIIAAATGAADFAAFKTAIGAITPVTRSIQVTPETREEITEPEEEPVKKTTRKKSTAKADTEKEGE